MKTDFAQMFHMLQWFRYTGASSNFTVHSKNCPKKPKHVRIYNV